MIGIQLKFAREKQGKLLEPSRSFDSDSRLSYLSLRIPIDLGGKALNGKITAAPPRRAFECTGYSGYKGSSSSHFPEPTKKRRSSCCNLCLRSQLWTAFEHSL